MIVGAAVVVLAAMLAAPALAAPAPTSWTVSPSSKIITYGQGVTLNGTLMSNGAAVGGLWVDVAQATTQAGSYEVMFKVTAPTGPYATGTYSIAVMPLQTMYYRFQWAGDATYAASRKRRDPRPGQAVARQALLPVQRQEGQEVHGQGLGQARGGHGSAVKVKSYRKNSNGAWDSYKTYSSNVSGTSTRRASRSTRPASTSSRPARRTARSSPPRNRLQQRADRQGRRLMRDDGPGELPIGQTARPVVVPLARARASRTPLSARLPQANLTVGTTSVLDARML